MRPKFEEAYYLFWARAITAGSNRHPSQIIWSRVGEGTFE